MGTDPSSQRVYQFRHQGIDQIFKASNIGVNPDNLKQKLSGFAAFLSAQLLFHIFIIRIHFAGLLIKTLRFFVLSGAL